jgi:hypothetical protein
MPFAGIEIDHDLVGMLEILDPRGPGMHLTTSISMRPSKPLRSSTQSRTPSPPSRFSMRSLCTTSGS